MITNRNWKPFIGCCAYHSTVGNFIDEDEDEWVGYLCNFINEMFSEEQLYPDDDSETMRSYRETFRILQENLANSAWSNLSVFDLEIAFEYVIPTSDPDKSFVSAKRADAVLFGRNRIVVLEFKTGQSETDIDAKKYDAIGQVNDYMRGLRDWHRFADGQTILGSIVMSALADTFDVAVFPPAGIEPATILSPDRVVDFISNCFVENSIPVPSPVYWLRAFGSAENPFEMIAGTISELAVKSFGSMRVLDGDEKAEIRRRIAHRLGLTSTKPWTPLVATLTNGRWQLRDAVIQLPEGLPQDRLEVLFEGFQDQE